MSKFAGHRLNIWFAEWCYVISTSFTKMSILLFYRRISVTFSKKFIIATWVGIIYNMLYMISFCMVLLLLCTPINAYWRSFNLEWAAAHPGNHCGKENIELPLAGVFSVIGDFYSAVLPMIAIFSLDLPSRQKLSLCALFSLAFLIVGAGIARTVLMWEMMNENYDFTWSKSAFDFEPREHQLISIVVLWEMWIWGMVELYVAILAASAPALKPFLRKFLVEPLETAAVMANSRRGIVGGVRPKRSFHRSDNGHRSRSKRTILASHNERPAPFSTSKNYLSVRESALFEDPEDIGIAYGGADSLTSKEDWFSREMDRQQLELDTRRYELKQGKEGRVVVTQVWTQQPRPQSSHSQRPGSAPRPNSSHRPNSRGHSTSRASANIRVAHVPVNRPVSVPVPPTVAFGTGRPALPHFPSHGSATDSEAQVPNFSKPYQMSYTAPSSPTTEVPGRLSWALPQLPWRDKDRGEKGFAAMQLKSI